MVMQVPRRTLIFSSPSLGVPMNTIWKTLKWCLPFMPGTCINSLHTHTHTKLLTGVLDFMLTCVWACVCARACVRTPRTGYGLNTWL
jgi:hypothetical protein